MSEFGILQALGAKKRDIFYMQAIEVLILMLIASIVSLMISISIILFVIMILSFMEGYRLEFYVGFARLRLLFVFKVLVSLVCVYLIAFKSTKFSIIDTIRKH